MTTDVVLVEAGARRAGELSSEPRVTSSTTTPTASTSAGGGGPGPERALVTRHQGSGHGDPGPAPGQTPGAAAAEISRHSAHAGPAQPGHRQVGS